MSSTRLVTKVLLVSLFSNPKPLALLKDGVDLDAITDDLEREATIGIIHNCK